MSDELFSVIEGNDFTARLSLASTWSSFKRLVFTERVVRELFEEAQASDGVELFQRIQYLLSFDFDSVFRHPHDATLAVYLHILGHVDHAKAAMAARLVRNKIGSSGMWIDKAIDIIVQGIVTANTSAYSPATYEFGREFANPRAEATEVTQLKFFKEFAVSNTEYFQAGIMCSGLPSTWTSVGSY